MRIPALSLAAVSLALATGASAAAAPLPPAQPATDAPQPVKKPVRKPPSDLESEAKRPRDGQVLPSDSAPPAPAPSTAPPPPAPPQPEPQPQPAAQPPPRQPAGPAAQPRPQPAPAYRTTMEPPAQPPKSSQENEPRFVAVDHVQVTFTAVQGEAAQVEWRTVEAGTTGKPGKWTPVSPNETVDDRIEVRTGLGVGLSLRLADQVNIDVSRLARLRIERKIRSDGTSQLGILLSRGELRITSAQKDDMGLAKSPVYIRTPDGTYPIRTHTSIAYDAFNNTTTQDLDAH